MRNWDPPLPQLIDHHAVHIPTKHRSSQPPIKEKGKKRNMLLQTAIVQTFGPSLTALMNIGRKLGGFFVFAVAKEGQKRKDGICRRQLRYGTAIWTPQTPSLV